AGRIGEGSRDGGLRKSKPFGEDLRGNRACETLCCLRLSHERGYKKCCHVTRLQCVQFLPLAESSFQYQSGCLPVAELRELHNDRKTGWKNSDSNGRFTGHRPGGRQTFFCRWRQSRSDIPACAR